MKNIHLLIIFLFALACTKESTITDSRIIFTKSAQTLENTRTFGLDIGDIDLNSADKELKKNNRKGLLNSF